MALPTSYADAYGIALIRTGPGPDGTLWHMDWVGVGGRDVNYDNLVAGTYTFKLVMVTGSNVPNLASQRYNSRVQLVVDARKR